MTSRPPERPPELVAATERPVELAGAPVSVTLVVPPSAEGLVPGPESAAEAERISLHVEEIAAERNPGIVYGVFLAMPPDAPAAEQARRHVGNLALFGIELMNDPDQPHDGAPGFRHIFEVTSVVEGLREAGEWDPRRIVVTFAPILPEPAPGRAADAAAHMGPLIDAAASCPVRVGRVALFVG